jgi:hypothetical protein
MSTAREIEVAIRALSLVEREKLIKDLPVLLPELDGDMAWNRIIGDVRSRPELTALLDQVEADFPVNRRFNRQNLRILPRLMAVAPGCDHPA